MARLNSFLCFELDTGGKLLAWLGMIGNGIGMFSTLFLLLIPLIVPCGTISHAIGPISSGFDNIAPIFFANICNAIKIVVVWVILLIFISNLGLFYMYYALLQGIKKRRSSQIIPAIIISFCDVFVRLLCFLVCESIQSYIYVVIINIIAFYYLFVLLSIRDKIKDEKMAAPQIHFLQHQTYQMNPYKV